MHVHTHTYEDLGNHIKNKKSLCKFIFGCFAISQSEALELQKDGWHDKRAQNRISKKS